MAITSDNITADAARPPAAYLAYSYLFLEITSVGSGSVLERGSEKRAWCGRRKSEDGRAASGVKGDGGGAQEDEERRMWA